MLIWMGIIGAAAAAICTAVFFLFAGKAEFPAQMLLSTIVYGVLLMMGVGFIIALAAAMIAKLLTRSLKHTADHEGYKEHGFVTNSITEIKEKRIRQKEAERIRQEFTANVSHELKTPITSIYGYAEMIESGMVEQKNVKEFAGRIRKEAGRLRALVGNIITLSELDEPQIKISFEHIDIYEIAKTCVSSLEMVAKKNNVYIVFEGSPTTINANGAMIEELIYNLIENSIRYNRPGGKVEVFVETKKNRIVLTVRDNGIGIPKDQQERIFERFYRVDKSRSKETGGTGLGLAIVKHVSEQHGASIQLNSFEGIGTEIMVTFAKPEDAGRQES